MSTSTYPVRVEATLDPHMSRWQWLVKWALVIPHYVVLLFLWIAFAVLSFVAFFAILFTERYPRSLFDFNVGVLRWSWRVAYYAYGALGTDRYPPFSLEDRPDYPAHLEVEYPEHLSRGLVLVKWWLLAIPHYLVIGLFLGGAGYVLDDAVGDGGATVAGGGLIGLLVLVAAVVLLFTGRYPRPIFDLVLGLNRWVIRVAAYAALMTDVYPPFRLDQGGADPGQLLTSPAAAWSPPAAAGATTPAIGPTTSPSTHEVRSWTAGRIVALVAGSVALLVSLGVGVAGAALAVADHGFRDEDGFLMSDTTQLTTSTYAITSTSVTVHADTPADNLPQRLLGDVKVRADAGPRAVFIGIAATSDVDAWLGNTEHATVTDYDRGPVYATSGSEPAGTAPAAAGFWVAQSEGTGTQQIVWPVDEGDWTLVVMNADASAGVVADVAVGATVPALDWLVPVLLVVAGAGLVLGVVLVAAAIRRSSTTAS
jgi:hypothetical protein